MWEVRTCSKGDPVQPQGEVTKVTHSQVFVKEPLGYEQKLYKGYPTRRRRCTLKMYTAADIVSSHMPPTPVGDTGIYGNIRDIYKSIIVYRFSGHLVTLGCVW